jgi:ADP-ribose pyrophosphatase
MSGTPLFSGKFLVIIQGEGGWEYAQRVNVAGAASIAAVTPEQKVILVEQYRIPVGARTIELPAGIIGDEPGEREESHVAAARRELFEETGYEAGEMEEVVSGPSSSGLTSERITLFRARNLKRIGQGGGIENENITVHEVPLSNVDAWLLAKAKTGVLIDPKVYAGLYFLSQPQ